MFRAWMAAISMGLLWVGLSAPASAGVPSCTEASKIFETARDGYARTAPPPSDAPDAETAQEQARGLDKSIAAKRAALDLWVKGVNAKGGFGVWCADVAFQPAQMQDIVERHSSQRLSA